MKPLKEKISITIDADVLKALRRKYGLSEGQMAQILKLSQDAVEALSRGEWSAEVDRGTLLLIYGYYGITPAQMLGDDGI